MVSPKDNVPVSGLAEVGIALGLLVGAHPTNADGFAGLVSYSQGAGRIESNALDCRWGDTRGREDCLATFGERRPDVVGRLLEDSVIGRRSMSLGRLY